MGIRKIRFCDITGSGKDVEPDEFNIDQMRVEIDLAATEYRKLIEIPRPYLNAGRVEAATFDVPSSARKRHTARLHRTRAAPSTREREQLRQWARSKGVPGPVNNRFRGALVEQWREQTTGHD
jgi:Lsr2 protein